MIVRISLLLIVSFCFPDYSFSTVMLTDSLLASYPLNGDAVDETGVYNGEISGAEITTDRFSKTISAYRFDGKNDHLDLGMDFTEGIDSLSISLWIYPYTESDPSDTLTVDSSEDQYFMFSGGVGESSGVYGIWNKGSLSVGQILSTTQTEEEYHEYLKDSAWHHIVMFFDAVEESAAVYINNEMAYTLDYEAGVSSTVMDSIYLGGPNFDGANGFYGKIDDVNFYNRKLDSLDIQSLYEDGCQDTLFIPNLHISSDTFLYAKSQITIDSLKIDTACDVSFITPAVYVKDISFIQSVSSMTIMNMDGCNHTMPVHDQHIEHRGIYINNFVSDGILGNELKEDSLLNWCVHQEFNNVYLYNIGSAMGGGMQEELDSFVHRANNENIDVTFVSASHGASFDNMEVYHQGYEFIPQGIVSEIEFWNGSKSYEDDYEPWLDRLDSLKFVTLSGEITPLNPNLMRRFYIGKIKNPGQPPSIEIAEDLILHHDEIFLTNYHSNGFNLSSSTSENSIRNKLSLIGEAAKNLNKQVNIVVLFNVRQDSPAPNIWSYFSEENENHDFRGCYEKFYHDFINASDIDFKSFINLKGYGIYRWTDAKMARLGID